MQSVPHVWRGDEWVPKPCPSLKGSHGPHSCEGQLGSAMVYVCPTPGMPRGPGLGWWHLSEEDSPLGLLSSPRSLSLRSHTPISGRHRGNSFLFGMRWEGKHLTPPDLKPPFRVQTALSPHWTMAVPIPPVLKLAPGDALKDAFTDFLQ